MADHSPPPGQPPGDSGGRPGPGQGLYVLWILVGLSAVLLLLLGIAVYAGSLAR